MTFLSHSPGDFTVSAEILSTCNSQIQGEEASVCQGFFSYTLKGQPLGGRGIHDGYPIYIPLESSLFHLLDVISEYRLHYCPF